MLHYILIKMGEDKNDHFSLTLWSNPLDYYYFIKVYFYSYIASLAFSCYCLHMYPFPSFYFQHMCILIFKAPKKWCFWTVVLEKTLESPLDCKEIQLVHPKGDQSWIFIGRTDAEAETPILWPPDAMSWLIWKDPDAGKDLRWEEKGMTEDEMVGWHHWFNGHEFE